MRISLVLAPLFAAVHAGKEGYVQVKFFNSRKCTGGTIGGYDAIALNTTTDDLDSSITTYKGDGNSLSGWGGGSPSFSPSPSPTPHAPTISPQPPAPAPCHSRVADTRRRSARRRPLHLLSWPEGCRRAHGGGRHASGLCTQGCVTRPEARLIPRVAVFVLLSRYPRAPLNPPQRGLCIQKGKYGTCE